MLLEIIAFERDPLPGCDLDLTIPHDREAVGEANVAGLGIADIASDICCDFIEDGIHFGRFIVSEFDVSRFARRTR